MKEHKIPPMDSIEELARFWDSHSLTEFEDQLEEVDEVVFQRGSENVTVRLRPDEVEAVKKVAEKEGVEYTSLLHDWILEKLHQFAV